MTSPIEPRTVETPRRDHRQEVTDHIVKLLEEGVAPWQRPWRSGGGMPMNPTTGRTYRGGNAVHLMAVGLEKGYDDSRWLTYKQAAANGWQVRHGERGTQIEYWEPAAKTAAPGLSRDQDAAQSVEPDRAERRLVHRIYTVFNAKQVEGIPPDSRQPRTAFEAEQSGERILAKSGAVILHDQAGRAFYDRRADTIHLPSKDRFEDAGAYYGTALHEMAHWTGAAHRLDRQTLRDSKTFGDESYAREELRAELASVFLAAELGIPHDPAQNAAYVGAWIAALKDGKHEIFRAAHDASAASDYLLALDRGLQRDQEKQPVAASLDTAKEVTAASMGPDARTYLADIHSGNYRGDIIGETDQHVIQRLSPRSAIAHPKHLLNALPQTGERAIISYANHQGNVRELRDKARTPELVR